MTLNGMTISRYVILKNGLVPSGDGLSYAESGGNKKGLCPMCRQGFNGETSIHVHHIIERCKGGGDGLNNLVMLHPNCHRQVHYLMKLGADTSFVSAHLTAGS